MMLYIARRIGASIIVLFVVVSATFLISHEIPADPARAAAGLHATPAAVAAVKQQLGLNASLLSQYTSYLSGLVHGNFGISYESRTAIWPQLSAAIPATLELVLYSFVVCVVLGVLAGVFLAGQRSMLPTLPLRAGTLLGACLPVFWFAIMLQLYLAAKWHWFPIEGRLDADAVAPGHITGLYTIDALLHGEWSTLVDAFYHLVLPVFSLVAWMIALTVRVSERAVRDEMQRPYIVTATSRGATTRRLLWRHALRNALNPIVTMLGLQFGWLLGGTILVEIVFAWGGIGTLMYNALQNFDYPTIVAITVVVTAGFVVVNLIVDLLYPVIDPRVRP
jgi:peptide/nickel transport system permease protein